MNSTQTPSLFVDLSTAAAQTVQGGCHRRAHRPTYYSYRPSTSFVYAPAFSYGYGYGGYGRGWSGGSVNQSVNVNVRYDD